MDEYEWEDCTIGFKCPFCKEILVADSQNEEQVCDCGRIRYSLSAKLNIKEVKYVD